MGEFGFSRKIRSWKGRWTSISRGLWRQGWWIYGSRWGEKSIYVARECMLNEKTDLKALFFSNINNRLPSELLSQWCASDTWKELEGIYWRSDICFIKLLMFYVVCRVCRHDYVTYLTHYSYRKTCGHITHTHTRDKRTDIVTVVLLETLMEYFGINNSFPRLRMILSRIWSHYRV